MGWNTSALFVESPRQVVLEAIASLGSLTDRELHYTEATLGALAPAMAIAELDGWTELWDPSCDLPLSPAHEPLRKALSRNGRALAVFWSSVTSQYGFWLYERGQLVRAVRYDHGEVAEQEGSPLAAEADIELPSWGMDEDWAFTIVERLTPITNASRDRTPYLAFAP